MTDEKSEAILDISSNTVYEAWSNVNGCVGYKVHYATGEVEYFYLNPSSETEDGIPNVFVYRGPHGDPAFDSAKCHFTLRPSNG